MRRPRVLITGFGPFEEYRVNPSAQLANELPVRLGPGVAARGAVLPVSFARAPGAYDRLLERAPGRPDLLLAIGVHSADSSLRLEARAPGTYREADRPDVDGTVAESVGRIGPDLATDCELEPLVQKLCARGAPAVRSEDPGQYLCGRIYHHLLTRAGELECRGLFVHVPPVQVLPLARQMEYLRFVVQELAFSPRS